VLAAVYRPYTILSLMEVYECDDRLPHLSPAFIDMTQILFETQLGRRRLLGRAQGRVAEHMAEQNWILVNIDRLDAQIRWDLSRHAR